MSNTTYAAIDIGSNAGRLLIKRVNSDSSATDLFTKELLLRVPLRLGQDSFTIGKLSPTKRKKLLRTIKAFRQMMLVFDVDCYRACATSAMRDAQNSREVVEEIYEKTGIRLEVITGQEEARIVYDNHIENLLDRSRNYSYVDVGGGSTEIILISHGEVISSKSYNVGTVRMLNRAVRAADLEKMHQELKETAGKYPEQIIIGSGGNINKLFRLVDERDTKSGTFPVSALERLTAQMRQYTPDELRKIYCLKPDRAEVIVPAAEIFLDVANCTGSTTIWTPTIGLADGIIDSLYARDHAKSKEQSPSND